MNITSRKVFEKYFFDYHLLVNKIIKGVGATSNNGF